jgi:hypothetical protein
LEVAKVLLPAICWVQISPLQENAENILSEMEMMNDFQRSEIPSALENEGFCFVDPAGFLDTKGPVQEAINSFANAKMFQRGVKTKIILVIE